MSSALKRFEDTPLLDRWNNLRPDELHLHYLELNGVKVASDGRALRPRGRKKGFVPRCRVCHRKGHLAKTCPERKEEVEGNG